MDNLIKGKITQEVIDILIDLMKTVIGDNAVEIILKRIKIENNAKGKTIVFAFAEASTKMLGKKGAFATLRQVGRELSKTMMAKHPKEEWELILSTALNDFGFAQEIIKKDDKAFICNCVFYDILKSKLLKPIQHSVCWTGWGFIEGFMRELKGIRGIQWKKRIQEEKRCQFDYLT